MSGRIADLAIAALAAAAFASPAAADCNGFPFDPFCGSRVIVGAVSGNTAVLSQQIDALGDVALQSVGPAHTTRLPDPNDPNGQGNLSDESAEAAIDFAQGVFAAEAGTLSGAVDFGASLDATASARVVFDEYLAVGSATLAPGTPVTLRLRYRVAFGAAQQHDLPAAAVNGTTQWATADVQLYSMLGGTYDPHRWFESADGTVIVNGIFSDPTQAAEVTAPATVGQTIRLMLDLRTIGTSKASVYSSPQFPDAATAATAALVFGIESEPPGATLASPQLGVAAPGFSGVTAANALAGVLPVAVGAPVEVPEPAAAGEALAASLGLAGFAAARRTRRASAAQQSATAAGSAIASASSRATSSAATPRARQASASARGRFSARPCASRAA